MTGIKAVQGVRIPMAYELIAAVDLGSNSFRLQVGRIVANQIYPLDGLKESVRLAAGLKADKRLDAACPAARHRCPGALCRAPARIRSGRRARGGHQYLARGEECAQFLERPRPRWAFPIEVIAGREEARLIYLGVAHTLAQPETRQLVVDIGGGSTEFIIGQNIDPIRLESLYMGCVSFSLRFFPDGKVDKRSPSRKRNWRRGASCRPSSMSFAKPAGTKPSVRPARPRPSSTCWN
jgi:exopolyphosphatase/guanosine-5'-triphosphate,3'-diphosphate pyrophosphatase